MSEVYGANPPIAAFLGGDSLAAGAAQAARILLAVLGSRRIEIFLATDEGGRQVVERLAAAPDPDPGVATEPGADRASDASAALAAEAIAGASEVVAEDRVAIALSASGPVLGALVVSPVPDRDALRREAMFVALGMRASSRFNRVSELERMKSEFVSIVSHELRTPLTTIKGCLDGIHRGYAANPETLTRMLQMARQNADRLGRLIDDLLDLARLERRTLVPRSVPVQLREILRDVGASKASMAEQRDVRLVVALPPVLPRVLGDEDRLFQAVANLADNAIKFCRPGDEVRLEALADDNHCTVRVADTGPGIDQTEQEAIFDKFYQLDSSVRRKAGGVGLGLFITREIVEALGGRIRVNSALGQGSVFEIRLPIADSQVEGGPTTGDILIIDDDPAFSQFVGLVLGREGYRVHAAGDSMHGVEMARALLPGLILVDLMMPEMDGWGVIEHLEEDPSTRGIPIVILSTLRPDRGAHRFQSYRYLEKSGHPRRLVAAIREFVRAAGPEAEPLTSTIPQLAGQESGASLVGTADAARTGSTGFADLIAREGEQIDAG